MFVFCPFTTLHKLLRFEKVGGTSTSPKPNDFLPSRVTLAFLLQSSSLKILPLTFFLSASPPLTNNFTRKSTLKGYTKDFLSLTTNALPLPALTLPPQKTSNMSLNAPFVITSSHISARIVKIASCLPSFDYPFFPPPPPPPCFVGLLRLFLYSCLRLTYRPDAHSLRLTFFLFPGFACYPLILLHRHQRAFVYIVFLTNGMSLVIARPPVLTHFCRLFSPPQLCSSLFPSLDVFAGPWLSYFSRHSCNRQGHRIDLVVFSMSIFVIACIFDGVGGWVVFFLVVFLWWGGGWWVLLVFFLGGLVVGFFFASRRFPLYRDASEGGRVRGKGFLSSFLFSPSESLFNYVLVHGRGRVFEEFPLIYSF